MVKKYWQIAAGEGARDYSDIFLKFGVMLMGSGGPGPYFENKMAYKGHRGWRSGVARFAEDAKKDEIVILKRAYHQQWEVVAVGRIVSDYQFLDQFDDVEGWNLPHCRKVEWTRPVQGRLTAHGLTRGTFLAVHNSDAKEKAEEILINGNHINATPIPPDANKIKDEELVEALIDNGLRPGESESVIETIWRTRRLAQWYRKQSWNISEHETRSFLIIPILLALGWSEQKMRIEWENTDIAFFADVYREHAHPCMILESKRMWAGLDYARNQAEKYAHLYQNCTRLVISDGMCYRLYERVENEWIWKAYMNLLRLRDGHPYEKSIGGAPQLFVNLMPK
jgi:hypothetical protein